MIRKAKGTSPKFSDINRDDDVYVWRHVLIGRMCELKRSCGKKLIKIACRRYFIIWVKF